MTVSSLLVGQSTTLTFTAYSDGTQTDIGTITLGITDANGDTVVSSGTSVTDNGDGTYEYTLAEQSEPNLLIITWTEAGGADFTTYLDVQGSSLFNENQLRNFDDGEIGDTATYSDDDIAKAHQRVVEYLEAQTGRSWIRRYNRVELAGSGTRILDLHAGIARTSAGLNLYRPGSHRDLISVIRANDGAAVTVGDIVVEDLNRLRRTDAAWTKTSSDDPLNVTVEYDYGLPYPVDGADRIGMMLARHWLVSSRIPDNAASFTDTFGTYSFDQTRLPFEVWKWIQDHKTGGYFA